MFPKLGMGELVVILLIVLLLFGANKIPQLASGLGQAIRGFKKSLDGQDEAKPTASPPPPSAPASQDQTKQA